MSRVDFSSAEGSIYGAEKIIPGQTSISAGSWNALVRATNAGRTVAAQGNPSMTGPYGNIIGVPKRARSASSPTPFKPMNKSTADEKQVKVTFGLVNNIVPTIDDTPLDAEEPPLLAVSGDGKIYIETVWTGDEPKTLESAEVKFTDGDVPEDDDEHGYRLLSTVTELESGAIRINVGVTCSLSVERMHCSSGEDSEGTTTYGWAGE